MCLCSRELPRSPSAAGSVDASVEATLHPKLAPDAPEHKKTHTHALDRPPGSFDVQNLPSLMRFTASLCVFFTNKAAMKGVGLLASCAAPPLLHLCLPSFLHPPPGILNGLCNRTLPRRGGSSAPSHMLFLSLEGGGRRGPCRGRAISAVSVTAVGLRRWRQQEKSHPRCSAGGGPTAGVSWSCSSAPSPSPAPATTILQ